jgi:hypothetical protein
MGAYLGDTMEQIRLAIDNDPQLKEVERAILKFGYFNEFIEGDYWTQDYVIDNGFHAMWMVREIKSKAVH